MHAFSVISYSVGLPNMLAMLRSEDLDVQIHAAKVIANLAADGKSFSPQFLFLYFELQLLHI